MSEKEMSFITIRDLEIRFSKIDENGKETVGRKVLDGISLDIEKGSFVAIVGMNGSGKSTLAKCLNGLLLPTSGSVTVDGFDTGDYEHIWDIRSRVSMVFQNPDNQIVSSIVEDDVAFGPENLGIDPEEIRVRVDNALRQVGMYELKDKGAHMLSGGQKQRIAIAGAVAMKPACIVFDEPTAMLDPKGRADVMNIIRQLNSEGITCILITHFMEEAEQADRILAMRSGKIICDRTPEGLFSDKEMVERAGLELPALIELREKAGLPSDLMTAEDIADYCARANKIYASTP
jgi:energy-coupling factor transporter ATPase